MIEFNSNIYSARLERSINLWGPHLFPLIIDAEMPLKGLRPLEDENFRSDYYSINGVVDVLSFSKINKLLNFAENQSKIQKTLDFYYDNDNRNKIIEYLSSIKKNWNQTASTMWTAEPFMPSRGMRRMSFSSRLPSRIIPDPKPMHGSEEIKLICRNLLWESYFT